MTGILGRRVRLLVLAAAVAVVAAGCVDFTGTKVITGEGEPTGDFVVRITCQIGAQTVSEDLTFQGEETLSTGDFNLLPSLGQATCTIEEIDQAGATSWFLECDGEPEIEIESLSTTDEASTAGGGGPGMSVALPSGVEPVPPSTATCTESEDGHTLTVEIELNEEADVHVNFIVTNDFTPEPPPPTTAGPTTTTTTAPPAPAPAAQPATGRPTFTG